MLSKDQKGGTVQQLDPQTREQLLRQHQQNHLSLPYFPWDVRGGIIEYIRVTVHPELLGDVLADFLRTQAFLEQSKTKNVPRVEVVADRESGGSSEVDEAAIQQSMGESITDYWPRKIAELISMINPVSEVKDPTFSDEWHLHWCRINIRSTEDWDSDCEDVFTSHSQAKLTKPESSSEALLTSPNEAKPSKEWHLDWCRLHTTGSSNWDSDDDESSINRNNIFGKNLNRSHFYRNNYDDHQFVHREVRDNSDNYYVCNNGVHRRLQKLCQSVYKENNDNAAKVQINEIEGGSGNVIRNRQSWIDEWKKFFDGEPKDVEQMEDYAP